MKTIVYGGAFDPPHGAHENIVREIVRRYNPERIVIVPSGSRSDKSYKIAHKHRMRILSIFADNLTDVGVEFCSVFMTGQVKDGTALGVDTFFQQQFGHSPVQVFGTDVIPHMKDWDPSGRVEREIPKIFVRRSGTPEVDFSCVDNHHTITPELPSNLATLSSSQIRENIKRQVFSGLAPEIAEYIRVHNLYR